MMKEKVKAVGYVRVSTEEQAAEGFSLDSQRNAIIKYCKKEEYELLEIHADEGISGKNMTERKGILQALRAIREGKANCLIVWKLSRLSRSLVDVVTIIEMLDKCGAYFISIEDNLDTRTPMGKPFLYLAGVFAEMERDNIAAQVKSGMRQKASMGQWNGGVVPLGYDAVDKELIVNEEEAKTGLSTVN